MGELIKQDTPLGFLQTPSQQHGMTTDMEELEESVASLLQPFVLFTAAAAEVCLPQWEVQGPIWWSIAGVDPLQAPGTQAPGQGAVLGKYGGPG